MGAWAKVSKRLREKGLKEGARSILVDAGHTIVDRDREIILLAVDLQSPQHRLRPRDAAVSKGFRLLPFDRRSMPRVLEMLAAAEPARLATPRQRLLTATLGFVAEQDGEVIGYVFYVPGCDDPNRRVHADHVWLPIRPRRGEVYLFDYFLREKDRGRGALFVRSVQEEHHRMGYTRAYGYVYAANTPALWLYRTTGWTEIGRVTEHRYLHRIAVVDRTVYHVADFGRRPLLHARK